MWCEQLARGNPVRSRGGASAAPMCSLGQGAIVRLNSIFFAGAALLCFAPLAEAQSFNQFIAFGDSTTDTGWFAHASTGVPAIDALVKNALAAAATRISLALARAMLKSLRASSAFQRIPQTP